MSTLPDDADALKTWRRDERRRLVAVFEGHVLPRGLAFEQSAQQRIVERVSGLVRGKRSDDRMPEQIQIADRVEYLVFHKLVVVAQPVAVQYAVLIEHDRQMHLLHPSVQTV